jgi:hypothetical protein
MLAIDPKAISFRHRTTSKPVLNERDLELVQKLETLMTEQEAYKDPDLTIVTL